MEKNEISEHEVKVFVALRSGKWMTNSDIHKACDGVSERTVRLHTHRLVALGVLDQAEVFPAHRYRLSDMASKRNAAYFKRLEAACKVFGLEAVESSRVYPDEVFENREIAAIRDVLGDVNNGIIGWAKGRKP